MSAFIVNHAHINALVSWAALKNMNYFDPHTNGTARIGTDNAQKIGEILLGENCKSVNYRYNEATNTTDGYRFKLSIKPMTPVQVLKAVKCLKYQSCEHPEWENSRAKVILDTIEAHAIPALPGYSSADWEIAA